MKPHHLFAACAVFSGLAWAGPSSQVAWTLDTLRQVEHADPNKGKQLAATCEGCHAPTAGNAANPSLRGQLATYLYKQIRDYQDGSRQNPIMAGMVAGLSEQDAADIAAYYSHEPAPAWRKPMLIPDNIEQLVGRGDGKRILPPCQACHEADGRGQKIDIPALAAQRAAYLEQTLLAYKSGERHNDLYSRMRSLTQQLSDEEIKQLARYYAGASE
ncbi:Cytochrome c553 [Methylomagnum ishizawai]|uniref:Cytochrome c553 n=1 Tax=Methylomagnum ishizawai TaxID=1760988 RepID=A0A1Y6D2B5_9GAMM|nr:c-type cytochrome [Methylomagnum ishizawai]SMF96726.1 Cytochrome c553 [Methylomagnum ishizawai]